MFLTFPLPSPPIYIQFLAHAWDPGFRIWLPSFFIPSWKQREATLAMMWGVSGFEEEEQDRPKFEGIEISSPVNGEPMLYFPDREKSFRANVACVRSYMAQLQSNETQSSWLHLVDSRLTLPVRLRICLSVCAYVSCISPTPIQAIVTFCIVMVIIIVASVFAFQWLLGSPMLKPLITVGGYDLASIISSVLNAVVIGVRRC